MIGLDSREFPKIQVLTFFQTVMPDYNFSNKCILLYLFYYKQPSWKYISLEIFSSINYKQTKFNKFSLDISVLHKYLHVSTLTLKDGQSGQSQYSCISRER